VPNWSWLSGTGEATSFLKRVREVAGPLIDPEEPHHVEMIVERSKNNSEVALN
jgi:hypothetical protein